MEKPKTLLDWGASFDLFTPLFAYVQDFMNGSSAKFGITPICNRRQLRQLLQKNGVQVWGLMLSPDASTLMFAVRKEQATKARQVLEGASIPIIYMPREAADSKEKRKDWFDQFFDNTPR